MRGRSVAITGRRQWSMASTKQQFDDVAAAALRWRFDEDWGGGEGGLVQNYDYSHTLAST